MRNDPDQPRPSTIKHLLVSLSLWLAFASAARAHNPDTSYARVRLQPDKLELRLTYDVFILQKIVPDLDANADRTLSKEELRRATPAIQQFLRGQVGLEVNGAATTLGTAGDPFWPLNAPDPLPAAVWHNNEALISFPFDLPLTTPAQSVALLFGVFDAFGDQHTILGFFEHQGRSHEVIFNLASAEYVYHVEPSASSANPGEAVRRSNLGTSPTLEFLWEGVKHIWEGYDHIAFLLALLVVSRLRQLIAIITSFTIAHSITLFLAARKIVTLPERFVECAIAATIVYVAVENLLRIGSDRAPAHRWLLTFAFGLIHGFGFANVLGGLELPEDSFVRCLLMFNVGVELGQLAIVLALLPLGVLLARWRYGENVKIAISVLVGLLGLLWFADRLFGLEMMPF